MKRCGISILFLFLVVTLGCSKKSTNDDENLKSIDKSANLLATGDSAKDLLSNDSFDKLIIEIAYVTDFRPSEAAMNNFVLFLKQRTFKENIEIVYTQLDSPNEESLTLEEIAKLESDNRTIYNNGTTLAIYIYFADAPSEEDNEDEDLVTLGAVYRNTSMIIHEVTVRKLASKSIIISNSDIETSTLNHEFGHLFGLVNLGTSTINDHEDPDAENHCNVQGCLMRAELQFGGPQNKNEQVQAKIGIEDEVQASCSLSGQSVLYMLEQRASKGLANAPGLDSECILDLQGNGGK
ncbi:MAG: hypothetical protein QM485_10960 [Flavobacteriaceae bacterium]